MRLTPYLFALTCMILWGVASLFAKAGLAQISPFVGLLIRSFAVSFVLLNHRDF